MEVKFPAANNKLAFFDFDGTLVAHQYSKDYVKTGHNNYFMACFYMLTSMEKEHKNDVPLPCMQWYANKLYEDGYGLYVLTHEIFNLRDEMKKNQLKEFYPNIPMTYLTVDTPEHKIDMITAVALAEECDLSDIIFVDDRTDIIELAKVAGIDAKHLSNIVVMYENSGESRQQGSVLKMKGFSDYVMDDPALMQKAAYEEFMSDVMGVSDENLEKVYQECRQLAEMNGRGKNV